MNERIQELKKQAWEYAMAVHDGQLVPSPDKAVWPIDKVLDEKFAELIVRECVEVCNGQATYDPQTLPYKPSKQFADAIKEHFGVEE